MDGFQLAQTIKEIWRTLVTMPSSASINKTVEPVPVYVKIKDKVKMVEAVTKENGKIILVLNDE